MVILRQAQNKVFYPSKGSILSLFDNPVCQIPRQAFDIFQTQKNLFILKLIMVGNIIDAKGCCFKVKTQGIGDIVTARIIKHDIKENIWIVSLEESQLKGQS